MLLLVLVARGHTVVSSIIDLARGHDFTTHQVPGAHIK